MKVTIDSTQNATASKKYDEWEVKDALQTLVKAREIRMNAELMPLVSKLAAKQKAAITDIADLKSAYNKLVDKKVPVVDPEADDLNDNPDDAALEAEIQAD